MGRKVGEKVPSLFSPFKGAFSLALASRREGLSLLNILFFELSFL